MLGRPDLQDWRRNEYAAAGFHQHDCPEEAEYPLMALNGDKVVCISCTPSATQQHDCEAHREVGRMISRLLSWEYEEKLAQLSQPVASRYCVPDQTWGEADAVRWGIANERDMFGGVVPYPFVGTKAICHPLALSRGPPHGWSGKLAEGLRDIVLEGYTAFDDSSAYQAGVSLLKSGTIRIKPCTERGGRGQIVVRTSRELKRAIESISHEQGTVLEREIVRPATFSIGSARVGHREISYWGTQSLTRDNRGGTAYGGSRLHVVLGPLAKLPDQRHLRPPMRLAIEQAILFERAVQRAYPSIFMSRSNYDIIQGLDGKGRWQSGVLEQSWRVGGASPAEIIALQAFEQAPCSSCLVETVERYGCDRAPPGDAHLVYSGEDPQAGELIKYARVIA
jgi:hypothetical protein